MEAINPFYTVNRTVYLLLSSAVLVGFSVTFYHNRDVLMSKTELLRWSSNTVIRIFGTIGTLVYLIMAVDYFGAFGIYSSFPRFIFSQLEVGCVWISLLVPSYRAAAASLVFWPSAELVIEQWQKNLRRSFWFFGVVMYILTFCFSAPIPLYLLVAFELIVSAIGTMVVLCVIFVYSRLRGFLKETCDDVNANEARKSSLRIAVRKWFKYTIGVTVFLGGQAWIILPLMVANNLRNIRDGLTTTLEDDIKHMRCCVPDTGSIITQFSYWAVFVLLLWRAWVGKDERARSARVTPQVRSSEYTSSGGGKVLVSCTRTATEKGSSTSR